MVIFYLLNTISGIGGISTISVPKINYLIKRYNYNVVVFVKNHPSDYEELHAGKLKIIKLKHSYTGLSTFGKIKYAIRFFKTFSFFQQKFKPDIVVSALTSIDFFSLPIIFWRLPLILEIHATSNIIIQWSHFFKLPFYKLYSKVVFLNEVEQSIFKLSNSEVIPNFISTESEINLEEKKNIIISGGRNDVIKQWHHQIEAWNKIFHQLPDWEFHIYIDGKIAEIDAYRSKINSDCHNLKIFQASKNFKKYLKEARVMVLSSKVESFSMNILEAFSFGTVVVSYATSSGPLCMIENGVTGILVEQNNINELAEAIFKISNDCDQMIELAHRAKVFSYSYSLETIMERWFSLFNTLHHEGS